MCVRTIVCVCMRAFECAIVSKNSQPPYPYHPLGPLCLHQVLEVHAELAASVPPQRSPRHFFPGLRQLLELCVCMQVNVCVCALGCVSCLSANTAESSNHTHTHTLSVVYTLSPTPYNVPHTCTQWHTHSHPPPTTKQTHTHTQSCTHSHPPPTM